MVECINYETSYKTDELRTFNFTLQSGSEWSLKEKWFRDEVSVYNSITLVKLRPVSSRYYFVDIEIRDLNQTLVLEKTSKGPCMKLDIIIDAKEFVNRMPNLESDKENCPLSLATGLECETLQYKLTLCPILELEHMEKKNKNTNVERQMIESLADHVSSLITNPKFDNLYDIVLSNDITEVKAHKSILSARLPGFSLTLCRNLNVHETSGLTLLKLNTPVLTDLVKYVYFDCFPKNLLTVANLYTTAVTLKVQGDVFLDVFIKKMPVEAVFFLTYFQDFTEDFDEVSLTKFYCNFHDVSESTVWTLVDIIFTCLRRASSKTNSQNVYFRATALRLAIYMVAKSIMTTT